VVVSGEVHLIELHICKYIFNPIFTSSLIRECLQNRNNLSYISLNYLVWVRFFSVVSGIVIEDGVKNIGFPGSLDWGFYSGLSVIICHYL